MSRSRQVLDLLRDYESRNVTFVDPDGCWPIVWESASGVHVRDVDGRRYLDLTAAFGVAAAGHANPRVTQAARRQMTRLLHAMGDVHPHELKARLARELSRITFERWSGPKNRIRGKTIFCNSGFEAVEAALKTAMLATGKPGVIAFEGAYHGLGYGALNATHRAHFRGPFEPQLGRFGHFVTFPPLDRPDSLGALESTLAKLFRRRAIGAILVEVVQARGGINVPPAGFLPLLRHVCDRSGALLIVDEIYTGFGRTGAWFACEHYNVMPDMVCLGKALTGGFPLSACVGRADLMDAAWPAATGEAIHTSTFVGHPVGCAMALEQIAEIRRLELVNRSAALGKVLLRELERVASNVSGYEVGARGLGLMAGLELRDRSGKPA
ncbi:MAG TPA: aspartate aminotransferase family protein, partial [Verrucomicrobiae bacterium]|nr:aspartate aminotransferase family protein [Verrucomicrobiae bacterium]